MNNLDKIKSLKSLSFLNITTVGKFIIISLLLMNLSIFSYITVKALVIGMYRDFIYTLMINIFFISCIYLIYKLKI